MSSDLRDLYQEAIVDHARRPRNFRRLPGANRHAKGHNPICGDRLAIDLVERAGRVEDIGFSGEGCAISMASASLMTELLKGKRLEEVEALSELFQRLLTGSAPLSAEERSSLGKLVMLAGVGEFPVRVKCATLPWHTVRAALRDEQTPVSTEQEASDGQ